MNVHLLCRIIGLCLLQNEICPLFLNRHVIKHLLGRGVRWTDLAFFDPIMFESLRKLVFDSETSGNSASMFESLDLYFSVEIPLEEVRMLVVVLIKVISDCIVLMLS